MDKTYTLSQVGFKHVIVQIISMAGVSLLLAVSMVLNSQGLLESLYGTGLCSVSPVIIPVYSQQPPYVIAVDPGHGGMDTGALAIVPEIQVIDTTAQALYQLLDSDPDFIPVMTRTASDPESGRRAQLANEGGASLLISLHANSDSHSSSKGFECFAQPPGRTFHQQSFRLAQLIVAGMADAGHTIRGDEQKTGIKYAYYYGDEKRIVDSSNDKIRSRKTFGILEKANCPRVLVEQCFITNQPDVNNWASETGCHTAAQIYYQAIKAYFSEI
ncbi:MAG: N-acetylmuramoyl-L-alanine amidase [Oscillospiraceae bacterium]|nr:N-acetylmuramoyl-L-alanine amidase [Oscillospiraceae bacterium]